MQLNLFTMATVGKEESGCCGEVVFLGSTTCLLCLFHAYYISYSGNTFICNDYIEMKYTKNMSNVLNQNVNVTKRAWFATFANRS